MEGEHIFSKFWWEAANNEIGRDTCILEDCDIFFAIPRLNIRLMELWFALQTENSGSIREKCTEVLATVLHVNRCKLDDAFILNYSPELPNGLLLANNLLEYSRKLNLCLMTHRVLLPARNIVKYECPIWVEDRLKEVLNDILQFLFVVSETDLRTLAKIRYRNLSPIRAAECEEQQINIFDPEI